MSFTPRPTTRASHLLNKLSQRTLSLSYRLSGDTRYAERALEWIHRWCIDQDSYMFPDGIVVAPFTPGLRPGGDVGIFLRGAEGKSAKLAVDYCLNGLLDIENWPFELIKPIEQEISAHPPAFLKIAQRQWGDARYQQVQEKYWPETQHLGEGALLFG
ncbi:alginate lyase family protein [Cerasicoccus fimbriatus]|uniref:alginate lyase family protein n=1 Tax=Cerasicoccus fimbriatus TaxID=3014554 RepID=UPI0022B34E87|nr:alginate lyase family protein [Cerasicoccus sp. TK19100]